ncbi:MAG TPA: chromosomal replication initiator protein DnaA, partial [Acidocella sp.]
MRDGGGVISSSSVRRDDAALNEQWARVRARLQAEVGEVEYRTWLKQVALAGVDGDEVTVILPTRFLRDWVNKEYGELITAFWQAENPEIRHVDIRTQPSRGTAPNLAEPEPAAPVASAPAAVAPRSELVAPLDQRFTFDTFVVGKPNEFAYACARRVAESPATQGFNPLFLYGGVGLGKTHLMHGIAWHIRRFAPHRKVIYLSAEKFMYQFIKALRFKDTMAFKEQFRSVDVLMIDDVQFISGKDSTQEEFFHTFNALVDQNRQIIISADKSPTDLEGMEERMRSRLGWGLVADIHPTTYELRLGILQAKAEQSKQSIPLKVMEFLAHKITSNVREL